MKKILLIALLAALCAGCRLLRPSKQVYETPLVVGERINIVKPGDIIEVPELICPAKTWYLVDDVGLSIWLGIPMKNIPGTMTAYDTAMSELKEVE